jgi:hypothetical protein
MFEKIIIYLKNNLLEVCIGIVFACSFILNVVNVLKKDFGKVFENLLIAFAFSVFYLCYLFLIQHFKNSKLEKIQKIKEKNSELFLEEFHRAPFPHTFKTLAKVAESFGLLIKEINNLFRWDKLRELLLFLITFGIVSNLFFPQILDIPIIIWKPFKFLHFKQDQKGGIFALFETYKPSDAVQMEIIKSGTLNTIVICVFVSAIFFIGGSKLLYSIPRILYEYNKLKNNSSQSK